MRNITLRSSYEKLSVLQVYSMPNVSILEKADYGFCGHSTINHDYDPKALRGDKVVVDNATGLMWHQSGCDKKFKLKKAAKWIEQLNNSGYAGYHDWRLPTVDEAASLLEQNMKTSSQYGGMYIDPVFSNKQAVIWTGDPIDEDVVFGRGAAWRVDFLNGLVHNRHIHISSYFVRPVRSVE